MKEPYVQNIGVNSKGGAVVRLRMANMSIVEIDTNVVSFSKLAAAGVPVHNEIVRSKK